jgi:ERCC4-type nuclease
MDFNRLAKDVMRKPMRSRVWMNTGISNIGISALIRAGFQSPEDAAKLSDEELLIVDGFGLRSLKQLRTHVENKNKPIGINLEPR